MSLEHPNPSINLRLNLNDFPCTWGTFNTVCTIIWNLSPGLQAATHDITEAYRTIPLHHSQWPVMVVCLPREEFCADTCVSFGMGPSTGVYGHVADAGIDILCTEGLGPMVKWVDNHLFFHVWWEYLESYNVSRVLTQAAMAPNGTPVRRATVIQRYSSQRWLCGRLR